MSSEAVENDPALEALREELRHSSVASVEDDAEDLAELEATDLEGDLTPTELRWIVATRDAAQQAGFDCSCALLVQLANVTKGRTEKALRRLAKMKQWEEEPIVANMTGTAAYKEANDTASPKNRGFCAAVRRAKNSSLAFAADYGTYHPAGLRVPVGIKAVITTFENCCSSLADVRRGVTIICNCNGVGYSNVSPAAELAMAKLYVEGYPVRINRMVLVDVTLVARVVLKAIRKVLPRKLNSRIHLLSGEELRDLFSQEALPCFLDGTNPPNADEWWADLHARREQWEAELAAKYGAGFSNI